MSKFESSYKLEIFVSIIITSFLILLAVISFQKIKANSENQTIEDVQTSNLLENLKGKTISNIQIGNRGKQIIISVDGRILVIESRKYPMKIN